MDLFVARQPILDREQKTVAYELLFRQGFEKVFSEINGNTATSQVISISTFESTFSQIATDKKSFINFTRFLLLEDIWKLLPKDRVVIELLENIEPDEQVVNACKRLKQNGYTLALDDFVFSTKFRELFKYADIVKIDLTLTDPQKFNLDTILRYNNKIKFLAEKVEEPQDFLLTKKLGYQFFQGFFFEKPQLVKVKTTQASRLSTMQLLHTVCSKEIDFGEAESIFKHDPPLTLKLLRYINSAAIGLRYKISGIRQALSIIGHNNLRKWILILTMAKTVDKKADELIKQTVYRAHFCELLAENTRLKNQAQELFITGMFSCIEALMDDTLDHILENINLSNEIEKTLKGEETNYSFVLALVIAYERGAWTDVFSLSNKIGINEMALPGLHKNAIDFADSLSALVQ